MYRLSALQFVGTFSARPQLSSHEAPRTSTPRSPRLSSPMMPLTSEEVSHSVSESNIFRVALMGAVTLLALILDGSYR